MTFPTQGSFSQAERVEPLSKLIFHLGMSLLVAALAGVLGLIFVPAESPLFFLALVVELAMIVGAVIVRARGGAVGYGFLYAFTAVTGFALAFPIFAYVSVLGGQLVAAAAGITAVSFLALSWYASRAESDFSFLGGFLFVGTIGLVLVGLLGLFLPMGPIMNYVYTIGGIAIFTGWILYDISQYKNGVPARDLPMAVLNVYLDVVNLFLFILRLMAILTGNSRS
ncbi:Bax inhibitor-1/YccA family protein [Brockia lithotrophica]|uniref:Modulator of FtsH protease n=1 Tax=Brockia lithotrophica TaxID=933949 RepID=A0A660L4R6_9BACL|nr:Bax inhibitor-1 family protein [Brockia lithotrophica]RKQ89031.1 modulator of FtsH protease [Brockia lithotrophica]